MVRELRIALLISLGTVGVGGCLSSLDERDLEGKNDGGTAGLPSGGTSGNAGMSGSGGSGASSGNGGSTSGKGGTANGTGKGGGAGTDSQAGSGGTAGDGPSSGGTSGSDAGAGGSDAGAGGNASGAGGTDNGAGSGNMGGAGGTDNTSGTGGDGGTGGSTGGAAGSAGASAGNGGSAGTTMLPPIEDGDPGFATRYWDCCKPTCAWSANVSGGTPARSCGANDAVISESSQSACSGGTAYACHALTPWAVNDQLAYGYAAVSEAECGRCYELEFTGTGHFNQSDAGSMAIRGKHMFVQAVNAGAVEPQQFDLLIPGGGVGTFNACSAQLGVNSSAFGAQYGGFLSDCATQSGDLATRKSCVRAKCADVFGDFPELLDGCDWFIDWLSLADNPDFVYREVDCPAELMERSGLDGGF